MTPKIGQALSPISLSRDIDAHNDFPMTTKSTRSFSFVRFFKNILAMLFMMSLCTVILLICAEFFLRWYYDDVLSTADGKSYFSVRSASMFRDEINGFRLRGKSFTPSHDGRYRIVVLGDSFTFGQGVYPASKRYTEKLEQQLWEHVPQDQVFVANAGVCGCNLRQYNRYVNFIEDIHPDFVLYQWYVNDMDSRPNYSRLKAPNLISNKEVHTYLWQHSALYYLLQHRYSQVRQVSGKQISYQQYLEERFLDPNTSYSIHARKQFVKLVNQFKEKEIDFGIVLFPSFSGSMQDYQLDFLHDRMMATCNELDVNCLDLRKAYEGIENKQLWANIFDQHPSELAHEIASQEIFNHFGTYWMEKAKERKTLLTAQNLTTTTSKPEENQ